MAMSQEPEAEETPPGSTTEQVIIIDSSSGRASALRRSPVASLPVRFLARLPRWLSARRALREERLAAKEARLVRQWQQWGRFRRWRRSRPLAGSILLMISGVLVLWGPVALIRLAMLPGSTLWAGLLVGALLVLMGFIQLLVPSYSLITGSVGVVLALISLIASSFGGFGIGMLLGIIGGALGVAWRPVGTPAKKRTRRSPRPTTP
jgi:hypothetical protein